MVSSRLELETKVIRRFVFTEKAPTRAFSWLKAATTAFTFKTLLRHYAKQALTPRSLNVKLGPRRKYHKGRALVGAFSVITNLRMELFQALLLTPPARCPGPRPPRCRCTSGRCGSWRRCRATRCSADRGASWAPRRRRSGDPCAAYQVTHVTLGTCAP